VSNPEPTSYLSRYQQTLDNFSCSEYFTNNVPVTVVRDVLKCFLMPEHLNYQRMSDRHGYADRQQADIISLLLFFRNKESRLKTMLPLEDFHLRSVMLTTDLLLNIILLLQTRTHTVFKFHGREYFSEFDSCSASLEQEPATESYPKSD
jgi:hypothetical protein